jgi:secondary thiamine-phosphate synthase enzyme
MDWLKDTLAYQTRGKGLYLITQDVQQILTEWKVQEGQVTLFVPHTSCSLALSECYDTDARADLEQFFERIAPENQPWHKHTLEGGNQPQQCHYPRGCTQTQPGSLAGDIPV